MRTTAFLVVLEGLAALSCMATVPSTEVLPPVSEVALLHAPLDSPLDAEFETQDGIARGHVEWANTCRRVVLVHDRTQDVEHTSPSYPAAAMAGMAAVGTGAGGVALLNSLDTFSTEQSCDVDSNGNESCSSPREDATAGGIVLVGTAVALAAASLVTAASKSTTTRGDVHDGPTREVRVLEDHVACGDGDLAGVGLSLYVAKERIAASVTDAGGDVAFHVPDWVTGSLTLVVDSVPLALRGISPGETVGKVQVDPAR